MVKADDSKKKEFCILIMVTDTEFNYQLKGPESRIGHFINFPVRCLDGVAISELKVGDTLAVNGAAVNILTKTLVAEVCNRPESSLIESSNIAELIGGEESMFAAFCQNTTITNTMKRKLFKKKRFLDG
jgi:hypothetical protein